MKKLILLTLVLTFIACKKTEKENKISVASWLVGSWENKADDGTMVESWEKSNDSTYVGTAYYIKNNDTLHHENMTLLQKGSEVVYMATVQGQNNDEPVTFLLTKSNPKQLVFENPNHDYPQKIAYQQITDDSLVASISGKQQGKISNESYSMTKKK